MTVRTKTVTTVTHIEDCPLGVHEERDAPPDAFVAFGFQIHDTARDLWRFAHVPDKRSFRQCLDILESQIKLARAIPCHDEALTK
jgi:hypothetical protein